MAISKIDRRNYEPKLKTRIERTACKWCGYEITVVFLIPRMDKINKHISRCPNCLKDV